VNELKRDAVLQARQGEYSQAAALWRQVVDRQPGVTDNLVNLARALVKAGQRQAALDVYARALALNAPVGVRRELVEAYAALGRIEESRKERATYERLKEERLRKLGGDR
jgi:tetratricopeptide (TPR) repeat protein